MDLAIWGTVRPDDRLVRMISADIAGRAMVKKGSLGSLLLSNIAHTYRISRRLLPSAEVFRYGIPSLNRRSV